MQVRITDAAASPYGSGSHSTRVIFALSSCIRNRLAGSLRSHRELPQVSARFPHVPLPGAGTIEWAHRDISPHCSRILLEHLGGRGIGEKGRGGGAWTPLAGERRGLVGEDGSLPLKRTIPNTESPWCTNVFTVISVTQLSIACRR